MSLEKGKFVLPDKLSQNHGKEIEGLIEQLKFGVIKRNANKGEAGSLQRFEQAIANDFVPNVANNEVFDDPSALRLAFKKWLAVYNDTPLHGFPNYGKSPKACFARATSKKGRLMVRGTATRRATVSLQRMFALSRS